MRPDRKHPKADLRKYYTIFLQIGLIVVLLFFLAVTKLSYRSEQKNVNLTGEQEVIKMEEIVQTKQIEKPPPPPRPPVPVEVPDDEIIEDEILHIDAELNLDEQLEMPSSPPEQDEEEGFFMVVEQMPELKGGLASIQQCVNYPEMARKAGIEGRVIVQFVVSKKGQVEGEPSVIRSIGGGADQEAVRCVKKAEFVPGRQRGKPVKVQLSLPVQFSLTSS